MRSARIAAAAALLVLGAVPGRGRAQVQEVQDQDLPRHVASYVLEFFNDSGTVRFSGRSRVPAGRTIQGDVAVLGGPFTVGGSLEGDLVVVNGDLVLEADATITGDVTVVGGQVYGPRQGVAGNLVVYEESLRYVHRGERIESAPRRSAREGRYRYHPWGRVHLSVRAGTNYNRIEGLPVMFGPVVESGGDNPFHMDAFGIWRTDEGFRFSGDKLGYLFNAEQSFGRSRVFSVGGTLHSTIEPIERWGLSDLESSLTTFLLHKDFRDYYEQKGWSVFTTLRAPRTPVSLTVEYRDEDHSSVFNGSPLTLRDNDEPWRAQPVVAEGNSRSVGARLQVDLRNEEEDPSDGWYLDARARFGVSGNLTMPDLLQETNQAGTFETLQASRPVDQTFAAGFLDVRRYNRVGPGAELHLRGVLGGSLNGDPLPPQYQHALGGEGSLPGYMLFQADCGARMTQVFVEHPEGDATATVPAFAGYGCDRVALFQAEYRSRLFFDVDVGGDDGRDWWVPHLQLDPTWAAFVDVGRGWSLSAPTAALDRFDTNTLADLGLGFFLGDLGLYVAVPLESSTDRGPNFFVRLNHRF